MCFSLIDRTSFNNITKQVCFTTKLNLRRVKYLFLKWYPEIRQYFNEAPILLVGLKQDLKQQQKTLCKQSNSFLESIMTNRMNFFGLKSKETYIMNAISKSTTIDNQISLDTYSNLNLNDGVEITKINNNDKQLIFIDSKPVRRKDCLKLSKLINAKDYLECSCYTSKSVQKVINNAIKIAFNYNQHKNESTSVQSKISYLHLIQRKFTLFQNINKESNLATIKNSVSTYSSFVNNLSNNSLVNKKNKICDLKNCSKDQMTLNCFCCTNLRQACDSF